ncbi:MAG: hypothetical protein IPN82_01295 [Chitinophagaceae bacterium]|nr:hypothetical protein [Chitinophagaceae bacterium]
METNQLQQQLFSFLKDSIPPHLSLVDELCDLLNLSHDSVYRRIRGEKPITLAELKIICEKYHISLDQLLQLENESVLFDAPGLNVMPAEFSDYLNAVLNQFKYFNSFTTRDMHYLCKDSTIWNFYLFPELAAFKTFFWSKTINNQAALSNKMFSFEEFPYHDCFLLGQQVLKEYNQIPSVELWNLESMHSTLNQIAYYKDAGIYAWRYRCLVPGIYSIFINELILGNNTMVINLDGKKLSMVTYSVFHYLFTKDPRFSTKVMASFDTLLNRSTLVSKTGEKDRNRFFNNIREKIKALG